MCACRINTILMSHTDRVSQSHMLNLRGLATSVHSNITIPESTRGPNPVYPCMISPCLILFPGSHCFFYSILSNSCASNRSIAFSTDPIRAPFVYIFLNRVGYIVTPKIRSDCLSHLGPDARSATDRTSVCFIA